jgi:hypothetical protein
MSIVMLLTMHELKGDQAGFVSRPRPSGWSWPVYAHRVSLLITVPMFGQHGYTRALGGDPEREGAKHLTGWGLCS